MEKYEKEIKKQKIKQFIKEKKGWFLTTGIFLSGGIIVFFVGMILTGWNPIEWLKTGYAVTFFVLTILGLYGSLMIFLFFKRIKLGKKY